MNKSIICLCAAALLAVSCKQEIYYGENSVLPLVREILSSVDSREYKALKSFNPRESDAAIYIIGDMEACKQASDELLKADDRDNIDGRFVPDTLFDFSGEWIASLIDVSCMSHDSLIIKGQGDSLRELTVRCLLKAIDNVCFVSPFDAEGLGTKKAAKLVVLADPAVSFYGYYDVDSLLTGSLCDLPVVCPVNILARELVCADNITGGVLALAARAGSGIYSDIFAKAATLGGFKNTECHVVAYDNSGDLLLSFLDRYIEAGLERPLDYLLVDVPGADIVKMNATLERVRSVMNPESLRYSSFIAPDFRIVESSTVLRRECYSILRQRGLFTHRIAYPESLKYLNLRRDGTVSLKDNMIIEYNTRYLPQ